MCCKMTKLCVHPTQTKIPLAVDYADKDLTAFKENQICFLCHF